MPQTEDPTTERFQLLTVSPEPITLTPLPLPPPLGPQNNPRRARKLAALAGGTDPKLPSSLSESKLPAALAIRDVADEAAQRCRVFTNTALTEVSTMTSGFAVCEPSVAMNGDVVFSAGSFYAAMSSDGGRTFTYFDPRSAFKSFMPPGFQFKSDQVINYIPSIDTFVWVLHYGNPKQRCNFERLAFAKTEDVKRGRWRLFDITAESLGFPLAYLDFPDVTVGTNCLYVTIDLFVSEDSQTQDVMPLGAALIRIRVDDISTSEIVAERYVMSGDVQSYRGTQNIGTTAYFAAHEDDATLRLIKWAESEDTPLKVLVPVAKWVDPDEYVSKCKDGSSWLDRADPRITGATKKGDELWFAWTAGANVPDQPHPYIQIAVIDAETLTATHSIQPIFDTDSAVAYPALATNVHGEIGITYMIGGGERNPSHVIGIVTGERQYVLISAGDRGPVVDGAGLGLWGDYLCIRPVFPDAEKFVATGYTMLGEVTLPNRDATPRLVVFGLA